MAKRRRQGPRLDRLGWWHDLPGWLQGLAALITAVVAAAAAFGLVKQNSNPTSAPITSAASSTNVNSTPEVFMSSVSTAYRKNAAGAAIETPSQGKSSANAVTVAGTSRYVPQLPPMPRNATSPVIVATAQLNSSPSSLWLVSAPAAVKASGEWTATIQLGKQQARPATLTVVALVVPYGALFKAVATPPSVASSCSRNEDCSTNSLPVPPTVLPSLLEVYGPETKEAIARSGAIMVPLNNR